MKTEAIFPHFPDAQTRLLGVIGDPVAHSLSPAMHNPALAWLGLNYRYMAFQVHPDRLREAVHGFRAMGMVGFNATIPHKEALLREMDWLHPLAQWIGAVNTVAIDPDGTLRGYNTDAQGFTDDLAGYFSGDLQATEVVVLGAGGAARGVVVGLLEEGAARITVANRTLERAERLVTELASHYPWATLTAAPLTLGAGQREKALPLGNCRLLVNTTSLGMSGEGGGMVDLAPLPDDALVYDIVYNPRRTPLLQAAEARGLQVANGLGMLVHQGARAFKIWTGQEMPVERIRQRLMVAVG